MIKKICLACVVCFIYTSVLTLKAADNQSFLPIDCDEVTKPVRVTARHIEGKGVGYNQGYTTIEGFISPHDLFNGSYLPYLDLRLHIFNNGKPASNIGAGLRYLNSRVWGVNAYYDYLKTTDFHYNQLSFGLESLGKLWDARLNVFLPVGKKQTSIRDIQFNRFSGHSMILASHYEFSMQGAHAEAGVHLDYLKNAPVYVALGPYYISGKGASAWGGDLRASITAYKYLKIEGKTSYDHLFGWIGQGELSLILPLGVKTPIYAKKNHSCHSAIKLLRRARQPVDRDEIIITDKKKVHTTAIDPSTGKPYFFVFVDNTSSSHGTFESPYSTLLTAQNASSTNDVIYVFPGDGTIKGMNDGITLKDNQKLFGAATQQHLLTQLGLISIPLLASNQPKISSLNHAIVTSSNNNEISGIDMIVTDILDVGIECNNIADVYIHDNTFNLDSGVGANIDGFSGTAQIKNNIFNVLTANATAGIYILNTKPEANYLINNNTFARSLLLSGSLSVGAYLSQYNINATSCTISSNQFTGLDQAIVCNAKLPTLVISNNTFSNCSDTSIFGFAGTVNIESIASGNVLSTIKNNQWLYDPLNSQKLSLLINNDHTQSRTCVTFSGNYSNSTTNPIYGSTYLFNNFVGGAFTLNDLNNNTGVSVDVGAITSGTCP